MAAGIKASADGLYGTLQVNSADIVTFNSSGNVGIGTTSPGTRLQVESTAASNNIKVVSELSGSVFYSGFEVARTGQSAGALMRSARNASIGGVGWEWLTTADNAAEGSGTYTSRMFLDSSGNVGIGTTSPSSKFVVANAGNGFEVNPDGTASGPTLIGYNRGTSTYLQMTYAGLQHVWNTSGTERARIDSSGNLNIANTAPLSSARLSVWNATSGAGGFAIGNSATAGQYRIFYTLTNGVCYFDNGTNLASLSSAGAWTNASDARLKNSIVDIKHGLSSVMNTQPRSYKMNDLEGDYIGFIAQELQTIIPEVVSGDPEKQLGVDYGSLVAVAFKAIQELKAIVDAQGAEIAALKSI